MTEDKRDNKEDVQALETLQDQITKLVQDLQQTTESFEFLAKLWKQRDKLNEDLKMKNETIQRLEQRIDEFEGQQLEVAIPSAEQTPSSSDDVIQRFLEKLSIALTKIIVTTKAHENLPTKLLQCVDETETILLEEGPPEMKVIVALGRSGGMAAPSSIKAETLLTQGEVDRAIAVLHASGMVLEETPGVFQLTALKTMETSISQWGTLASVPEIFNQCKNFIQATNDTEEISKALDVLRDALFTKGASGVIVSEIAKEARKWLTGSGDKKELMDLLTEWEERSPA